jgi:hypothetical protein
VIVILASELDAVARECAAGWPGGVAKLLTPRDLCTQGWRINLDEFEKSQIVVDGSIHPVSAVSGVVTLMSAVMDYELFSIEDTERRYVASEVTALLYYFLSRLRCRVLNRPTAHCLSGPSWRAQHWIHALHKAGVLAESLTVDQSFSPALYGPTTTQAQVAIVGSQRVGEGAISMHSLSALAQIAGVDFLSIGMNGEGHARRITSIELIPDLRDRHILDAVHNYFAS